MAKRSVIIFALLILAIASLIGEVRGLNKRVTALEHACHAQCKYGDEECAKMCLKNGHCEFVGM
jgi:hypothetical protein